MREKPNISLEVSEGMIIECITDLYINPKKSIIKWSKITNQTAQGKFAYPSQHLASLITKTKGGGSTARGDDLADGSEVKSCTRADQLNECKKCGANILTWQNKCPYCGSTEIKTDISSHWIFPITSDSELDLLLNKIPRIILILFDKEDIKKDNIRIRAWTINPKEKYVRDFFTDYYENNYKKKISEGKDPAPCNLHPLKYDFYLMNPKLIFHTEIMENEAKILFWNLDRPQEQPMVSSLLVKEKLIEIYGEEVRNLKKEDIVKKYPFISDKDFSKLEMKKKILKSYKEKYQRR
ncbi:MamI family restriction endonuclease [Candidatus Pacearchaeota archaeon]|nr:MamI family restriction endonuclease [Candidatus Pacearchaeota archaeon]